MRRTPKSKTAGGRPRTRPVSAIGHTIVALASRRGMTLDTLSESSGVNLSTLYRIVAGTQDPKLSTAVAIASALGVTLTQLAAGHGVAHRTSA